MTGGAEEGQLDLHLGLLLKVVEVGDVTGNSLGGFAPKADSTSKLKNASNDDGLPKFQSARADRGGEAARRMEIRIFDSRFSKIVGTHEFATSFAPMPQATKKAARPPQTTIQSHLRARKRDETEKFA